LFYIPCLAAIYNNPAFGLRSLVHTGSTNFLGTDSLGHPLDNPS